MRADAWWAQPLACFSGLGTFVVYSTWAAFQGDYYFGPYFRRFIRRRFLALTAQFVRAEAGLVAGLAAVFAGLLVLWAPGGFRLTCYYYRGAYYKAFWADPPACTVGEPRRSISASVPFPLIMQNVHRYFLYLALSLFSCSPHDVWKAMWFAIPRPARPSSELVSARSCWR